MSDRRDGVRVAEARATGTVLLDIEGTVAPIRFVHETLFPFARARLDGFLAAHGDAPAVREVLGRVPGEDRRATLLGWMDRDAKEEPLKTLQGMIWADGYASGQLRGELYPDVAPALRRWHARGIRLAVYSSGSVAAQRLIFGHSGDGDLAGLFEGFFDTLVGGKREAASYRAIAAALGADAATVLFASDVAAELDAARAAGMATVQLVRPEDGTVASGGHAVAVTLDAITLDAVALP